MNANKIAIILNSCDAYSDIWEVFFIQLKRNFPLIFSMNVYINSESKNHMDSELNIINIHPPKEMSWSNRLKYCVSRIHEEFVISIPEECILESEVDVVKFEQAVRLLENNINCAVVQLVKIPGVKIGSKLGPYIERKYNYRNLISQQASIWKTSKYFEYIRSNETPWEFEILSSARGPIRDDKFYCIADDEIEVFNYNYGILVTRGFWVKEELDRLETKLGISFDKSVRPVLTFDEINKKINRWSMFYWSLRLKKYIILLAKLIGNLNNKEKE
jgi:hypothetical protein